jgi:hypothetical protein
MMNTVSRHQTLSLSHREIKDLLTRGQNPYWYQLNADLVKRLSEDFDRWPAPPASEIEQERRKLGRKAQHLVNFLLYDINQITGLRDFAPGELDFRDIRQRQNANEQNNVLRNVE